MQLIQKRNHKYLIVIFLIYGTIYSSISFVNHYLFRTYSLDLGLYNKVLYDYATFSTNNYSVLAHRFPHHLADHFSLLIPLISPFYWIFKSYTLLVFQIVSILFGAYGIYKFLVLKYDNTKIAILAVVHFLSIWGIYSALSFDYHDNVVAAMFVPWLFWSFEKYKIKYILIFVLLICFAKENMALWCGFILLGIGFQHRKEKAKRNLALQLSFFVLVYFVLVLKVVMPSIDYDGKVHQLDRYAALGTSLGEIFFNLINHPINSFKLFFDNTATPQEYYGIKTELHLMVLTAGGIVFLIRPIWLLMLFPIYAQKMWTNDFGLWGINNQYSIEFVPIICLALFSYIVELKSKINKIILTVFFIVITLNSTINTIEERESFWYNPENSMFFDKKHYSANFDVKELNTSLELIPTKASVSAQSFVVPHVFERKNVFMFPDKMDEADYIILVYQNTKYPLSEEYYNMVVKKLLVDKKHKLMYCKNYTYIFKKINF
ncbi:MAG: DUF2079 domain-containing protein [Bacteroidota bacterium]